MLLNLISYYRFKITETQFGDVQDHHKHSNYIHTSMFVKVVGHGVCGTGETFKTAIKTLNYIHTSMFVKVVRHGVCGTGETFKTTINTPTIYILVCL